MTEKEKIRKKEILENKKLLEKDIATSEDFDLPPETPCSLYTSGANSAVFKGFSKSSSEKVKKTARNLVSDGKKICRAADKSKDQLKIRLKLLDRLGDTLIKSDDNKWGIYEDIAEKDKKSHATQVSFAADLEKQRTNIGTMAPTAGSFAATNMSGTTVMYTAFGDDSAVSSELYSELEKTTKESFEGVVEFIEKEISSILPGSEKKFENVIVEWSATASEKYKILYLTSFSRGPINPTFFRCFPVGSIGHPL